MGVGGDRLVATLNKLCCMNPNYTDEFCEAEKRVWK